MSFSPVNESAFNDARLSKTFISPCSGMCSCCTAECVGTCEIGLAAVRGEEIVYPTNTGDNQIGSEKDNPLNYSIFNINGRCFGALGLPADNDISTIFNVDLTGTLGKENKVKLNVPFVLPALIKLMWKDYFAAAAMIGTVCVIGESSYEKDPEAEIKNGKLEKFNMLSDMLASFKRYYRGYGQIVVQCNADDDKLGLPDFALTQCGAEAIEFKFGQSAKGVQPAVRLNSLEEAIEQKRLGFIIHPDPDILERRTELRENALPQFWVYNRLPMWTEEYLMKRIADLRTLGMKNVYFKMAGYDKRDLERVIRLASDVCVDMITIDGSGGGSGYSPNRMMNEWGLPPVCIESVVNEICKNLVAEGKEIPFITIAGGITGEDQAYKALALGAPYVKGVGLCRATMAAAMVGKKVGELLDKGTIPKHLTRFGSTKEELFLELGEIKSLYGKTADHISLGAVGAYSYLKKMAFGVRHFAALNRKFALQYINKEDLIPLTEDARKLLNGTWCNW